MRILGMLVVLWVLVTIVFLLGSVVPSEPARAYAGAGASPQVIAQKRKELGLDQPLAVRYVDYLGRLAQGDLSESVHTHKPVADDIAEALPATLELLFAAVMITVLIGLGVGVATARPRRGTGLLRGALVAGASVPVFTLGLLALFLFYYKLGWFPSGGQVSPGAATVSGPTGFLIVDSLLRGQPEVFFDVLWHLVLPATALALTPALLTARTLRSSLRFSLRQDYARTARAKGLRERDVLWRHALRNSLNAPLTICGLELGGMLAGIAVVETIFAWPGIGLYIDRSIAAGDVPAIAGVTLVTGIVFVFANAIVDLLQLAVDPRLRRLA
ncbi:MAG: ABC transporter permease [Actinobacteria bacterium]|nr:ABC transporter permease [Actinomycetota bacterium]